MMYHIAVVLLLLVGQPAADSGFLAVNSNVPGIAIYVEGDFFGSTPVAAKPLAPGSYLVTVVSNDSLENVYARLRSGPLGAKLSSLWTLAAVNAGTFQVDVGRGRVTEVMLDYGAVLDAPCRAKWLAGGITGGLFILGAAVGLLIGYLAFNQ